MKLGPLTQVVPNVIKSQLDRVANYTQKAEKKTATRDRPHHLTDKSHEIVYRKKVAKIRVPPKKENSRARQKDKSRKNGLRREGRWPPK